MNSVQLISKTLFNPQKNTQLIKKELLVQTAIEEFLRKRLFAFAIKTPSNRLLFSQCMQIYLNKNDQIHKLFKNLNLFIQMKDKIFTQHLAKDILRKFTLYLQAHYSEIKNVASPNKMRLHFLRDLQSSTLSAEKELRVDAITC